MTGAEFGARHWRAAAIAELVLVWAKALLSAARLKEVASMWVRTGAGARTKEAGSVLIREP